MRPINKEGWYDCWGDNEAWKKNDRFFDTLEIICAALGIGLLFAYIITKLFIV